jgi:hypothetical protein
LAAGPQEAKNLAGQKGPQPDQIQFRRLLSIEKFCRIVKSIRVSANRRFEFNKGSELVIGVQDETFSVAAMCASQSNCRNNGAEYAHFGKFIRK